MFAKWYGVVAILLHFLILSEGFIIPILFYYGVKKHWTKTNSSVPKAVVFKPQEAPTTTPTTTTSTTRKSPTDEYFYLNNPCGYGPQPAYNPQDEWFSNKDMPFPKYIQKSKYKYSLKDVGSDIYGYFLLYSLQSMQVPNFYSRKSFFKLDKPIYNHYKISRYNFNIEANNIPERSKINAVHIINCTEDSMLICPSNTMSLCTSNGAILCVANQTSTVPCKFGAETQFSDINCISTRVLVKKQDTSDLWVNEMLPCMSFVKINGNIGFNTRGNNVVSKEKQIMEQKKEEEKQKRKAYNENLAKQAVDDLLNGREPINIGIFVHNFKEVVNEMHKHFDQKFENLTPKISKHQELALKKLAKPGTSDFTTFRKKRHSDSHDFCVTLIALPSKEIK